MATKTCRVLSITKDEMKWCGSRSIRAELADEEGRTHIIDWVRTPTVFSSRNYRMYSSKKPAAFEKVWENTKEGDVVEYVCQDGDEGEYFIPKNDD